MQRRAPLPPLAALALVGQLLDVAHVTWLCGVSQLAVSVESGCGKRVSAASGETTAGAVRMPGAEVWPR